MPMTEYYVYIMSNVSRTLSIGVTNNLERRVYEHKQKQVAGFTQKYIVTNLVYMKSFPDPRSAIEREKQLKKWRREKKIALLEMMNPGWMDLSAEWSRS